MHENREIPVVTTAPSAVVRVMKASTADDHHVRDGEVGRGRSTDDVPKAAAEVTEGRPETEGNLEGTTTPGTQCPERV